MVMSPSDIERQSGGGTPKAALAALLREVLGPFFSSSSTAMLANIVRAETLLRNSIRAGSKDKLSELMDLADKADAPRTGDLDSRRQILRVWQTQVEANRNDPAAMAVFGHVASVADRSTERYFEGFKGFTAPDTDPTNPPTSFASRTPSSSPRPASVRSTSAGADRVLTQNNSRATTSSGGGGSFSSGGTTTGSGSSGTTSGGGGSSSSTGGGTTGAGTEGGPDQRLPGGYQVWDINGTPHLIYTVPGSSTPMAWKVTDKLQDVIGSENIDQTLTAKQAASKGVLVMGRYTDLKNSEQDPFDTFLDNINERALIEPWLKDPQVLAQAAEAYLEGRGISQTDLRETDWYNERTDKERAWVQLAASASPAELQSMRADHEEMLRQNLLSMGVSDPPAQLVKYLAQQDLTGTWSDVQLTQQLTAISDPYAGVTMDAGLKAAMKGMDLVTSAQDVRAMRGRAEEWLGPFASSYTDKQLMEWSGLVRNDPNGEAKVEDILRGQRMALLPEYSNPDVRWADAAAPWQSFLQQQWGEQVDFDDPALLDIVRANDMNTAKSLALKVGTQRGVAGAVNQVTGALTSAFGNGVTGSV